jgi:hypothetical protein
MILAQSPPLQQTPATYLIPTVRFAGHGDGEVELVQGGDVGGYDGHHLSSLDAEWCDRGGYLEASMVGLWPRLGDVVVDDRRAITVGSGCPFQKA